MVYEYCDDQNHKLSWQIIRISALLTLRDNREFTSSLLCTVHIQSYSIRYFSQPLISSDLPSLWEMLPYVQGFTWVMLLHNKTQL